MTTVSKLEGVIAAMKEPILDSTDNSMITNNSGQDVESTLNAVGGRMDEIHKGIVDSINNPYAVDDSPSIRNLLKQKGILKDLQSDPSIKESLIAVANLHLKEYPFTRKTDHARNLAAAKTIPDHNIIPNTENSRRQ